MSDFRRRIMIGISTPANNPSDDGYIWAYYNVVSTESNTKLLDATTGITGNMIVDGTEVALATTYLFSTIGEHLVKFRVTGDSLGSSFSKIPNLSKCYIPSDCHTYGNYSFDQCTTLSKIYCFGDVTSITTNYCFTRSPIQSFNFDKWKVNCTNNSGNFSNHRLSGIIEIPEGVTSPPYFSSTAALTTGLPDLHIVLPSSTTIIRNYFCLNSKNLKSVTCKATEPPTVSYSMFNGCSNLQAIYVPSNSVNDYKAANKWSAHASKIQAIPE